jgi:hypothetical protein
MFGAIDDINEASTEARASGNPGLLAMTQGRRVVGLACKAPKCRDRSDLTLI